MRGRIHDLTSVCHLPNVQIACNCNGVNGFMDVMERLSIPFLSRPFMGEDAPSDARRIVQ